MRIPQMIIEEYCEAWHEFYNWEVPYCLNILNTVQVPSTSSKLASYDRLLEDVSCTFNGWEDSMEVDNSDSEASPSSSLTISSIDLDRRDYGPDHAKVVSISPEVVSIGTISIASFAYPKYESCTPAIRSISHHRSVQVLEFIPYADEAGFSGIPYARLYDTFMWQTSWYDVDCEYFLLVYDLTWQL